MIDSDILIWILRDNEEVKDRFRKAVSKTQGQLFITPIQYMEIIAGVRAKEVVTTELFLDSLQMININRAIGNLAGVFLSKYQKSHAIHNADALIAAAAKINDLTVWTNNKKHYPMLNRGDFYAAQP